LWFDDLRDSSKLVHLRIDVARWNGITKVFISVSSSLQ
jgi:hypothetical protein